MTYEEKVSRLRELNTLDRKMTPEEWAEFKQLMNEGVTLP